ncbi:hypothetical protein [Paracoccus endophyticus]|uniref:hypothetical protein n=1 Tax=Paracoccus endophyticus TaxID=2233774 RepID=UPI000DDB1564|nr:hypothetical protein [Paracoccus endophyticus]
MRTFFVNSFERVVGVIVVLMGIAIVVAAFAALTQPQGGVLPFLAILAGGFVYLVLMAGFVYLQIGIHANTKRAADAAEAVLARRAV